MTVYLTSFKRYFDGYPSSQPHNDTFRDRMPGYSIAVYQPKWYPDLPKVDIFDIRENGKWIRPRDFIIAEELTPEDVKGGPLPPNPALLKRYHNTLLSLYEKRYHHLARGNDMAFQLEELVPTKGHDHDYDDIALCCWCPFDKAAKRQLQDYGSFVCHSWPVETFLQELGVSVVRDFDRERMVR